MALAVAALIALAACSSTRTRSAPKASSSTPSGPTLVSAAVITGAISKTQAKSARVSTTIDILKSANEPEGTITGGGACAFKTKLCTFTFNFQVEGSTFNGSVEERLVPGVIYMKVPELSSSTGAKPWLKLDFSELGRITGVDLGQISQYRSQDPSEGLAYLTGVSGSIEEVGSDTVRGVQTTHYKATIDLDKALSRYPASVRAGVQSLIDKFGMHTMPVEAWIDADGLTRRVTYSIDLSKAPGFDIGGAINATLEFYDYGTPVSVSAPPASQVTDFFQLLQQLQGK